MPRCDFAAMEWWCCLEAGHEGPHTSESLPAPRSSGEAAARVGHTLECAVWIGQDCNCAFASPSPVSAAVTPTFAQQFKPMSAGTSCDVSCIRCGQPESRHSGGMPNYCPVYATFAASPPVAEPGEPDRLVARAREILNEADFYAIVALLEEHESLTTALASMQRERDEAWEIVRQKERDAYQSSNSLDVQELDARCGELGLKVSRLNTRLAASERARIEDAHDSMGDASLLRSRLTAAEAERDGMREAIDKARERLGHGYGEHMGKLSHEFYEPWCALCILNRAAALATLSPVQETPK